jgi:predicted lipid carrier protein YhbT
MVLASEAECEQAFVGLADLLAGLDPDVRKKYVIDRTVSCRVSDLGVTWSGRVCDQGVLGMTTTDESRAQVRLTVASNDLLALTEGRLTVGSAFATGKLRIQASPLDLLRLGSFL